MSPLGDAYRAQTCAAWYNAEDSLRNNTPTLADGAFGVGAALCTYGLVDLYSPAHAALVVGSALVLLAIAGNLRGHK